MERLGKDGIACVLGALTALERSDQKAMGGRDIPVGTTITEAKLSDYIAGLVVTNDVSARDIQLPQTQFYEAKSYPTFTPVGRTAVKYA